MMDSDSEDELMKTLDAFGTTGHLCSYCDDSSAHMACTTCGTAYYCDQVRLYVYILEFYLCIHLCFIELSSR